MWSTNLLLKSETATVKPISKTEHTGNRRIGRTTKTTWYSRGAAISPAICRTSRAIAAESLPVLYGLNTFEFPALGPNIDDFSWMIGSNKLLVNRVQLRIYDHHQHRFNRKCGGEDKIYDDMEDVGYALLYLRDFLNVKFLSVKFESSSSFYTPCPEFHLALGKFDSDLVVAFLGTKLHSLVALDIEGFPAETVKYILEFLQSGQDYKGPHSRDSYLQHWYQSECPTKPPVRPLPPQACLSCKNCTCAHAEKSAQQVKLQETLADVRAQISGEATKLDEKTMKMLEQLTMTLV